VNDASICTSCVRKDAQGGRVSMMRPFPGSTAAFNASSQHRHSPAGNFLDDETAHGAVAGWCLRLRTIFRCARIIARAMVGRIIATPAIRPARRPSASLIRRHSVISAHLLHSYSRHESLWFRSQRVRPKTPAASRSFAAFGLYFMVQEPKDEMRVVEKFIATKARVWRHRLRLGTSGQWAGAVLRRKFAGTGRACTCGGN